MHQQLYFTTLFFLLYVFFSGTTYRWPLLWIMHFYSHTHWDSTVMYFVFFFYVYLILINIVVHHKNKTRRAKFNQLWIFVLFLLVGSGTTYRWPLLWIMCSSRRAVARTCECAPYFFSFLKIITCMPLLNQSICDY